MHQSRHWCPGCYKRQLRLADYCWDPLVWSLKPVEICPEHRTPLRYRCEACSATQPYIGSLPYLQYCERCFTPLYAQGTGAVADDGPSQDSLRWVARACVDLLAWSPDEAGGRSTSVVGEKVQRLVVEYCDGDVKAFSSRVGVPKDFIRSLIHGRAQPTFATFLDLCHRLDMPPRAMLSLNGQLTEPSTWRKPKRPVFRVLSCVNRRARRRNTKELLLRALREGSVGPGGLGAMAKEARVSLTFLKTMFPDLARRILAVGRKCRRQGVEARARDRERRRDLAEKDIRQKGEKVTDRRLKQTGHVKTSDLRRKPAR